VLTHLFHRPSPGTTRARAAAATVLLATAAATVFANSASAASTPVTLNSADAFAVLAGAGITNAGPTTVNADTGTYPTPAETGFNSVTFAGGSDQDADTVTQTAKGDLANAYDTAAGLGPATDLPAELGGTILTPGIYASPTFGLTGTLVLDAQDDPNAQFVFQAGTTLTTAADSSIVLINGANACDVFWQLGTSATFGTDTDFTGEVLAHTAITATTGATFRGRLLAETAGVTLDTNTVTAPDCPAAIPVTPPTPPAPTTPPPSSPVIPSPSPTPPTTAQPTTAPPVSTSTSASPTRSTPPPASPAGPAIGTTTTLTESPTRGGTTVGLTATITPATGSVQPTGTVGIYRGTTLLTSGQLHGGTTVHLTAPLLPGVNSLTAIYTPGNGFRGSRSTTLQITGQHEATGELPFTGSPTWSLILLGGAFISGGAALLRIPRRRRHVDE
jgi:hypothetical protein